MEQLGNTLKLLIEPTGIILALVCFLILNSWFFKRLKLNHKGRNVTKQTLAILAVLIGTLSFILVLPIDKSLKGQVLSFLAIIISAGVALSSTTVLGNLMAGIMNNSMNRFRNGDLIKIGDLQGRVTKKSIFHTEIQLEDSNFVTIPNLFVATNPVKLTRKTNTVVSCAISLGYDVSRIKVEEALKKAALETGLTDPYVYITQLGDFSVVYKIHGFLANSDKFFSTSSQLNGKVMDVLHKIGIEIVSPGFVNQRRVEDIKFIPKQVVEKTTEKKEASPEELVFDKAIKSEEIEKKKDLLVSMDTQKETLKKKLKETDEKEEVENVKSSIKQIDKLKEKIEEKIDKHDKSSID